jgi:hypothetical protein
MKGRPSFIYSIAPVTATAAASDTASGYAAQNIMEACEDTSWKPANITGSKTININLGLVLPLGAVAILGQYLNGITLEIRGSNDNFVSDNVQLSAPTVINSPTFNTAYRLFTGVDYQYISLIMSGFGASSEIMHVAACREVSLPYLEDNHDAESYQPTGTHLVAPSGVYLGSSQQSTMRNLTLDFGQIPTSMFPAFQLWAEACIKTMKPFFYVPDVDQPECHFGWADAKYKFSAPSKLGRHKIAAIPFTSRLA